MSNIYVALDVETTGLDASSEAIIEVAAIVFRDNDILDEYTTLVNPQRDVPAEITRLTGITQAMVSDAPTMHTVRPRLRQMFADHVLIGHNVGFDMGFLRAERLGVGHHTLDTLTLASILVAEAGRFGLDALARYLHLPNADAGQKHRALDDTEQTVELFLALQERALALEMWQLEEIVAAGRRSSWPETLFFEDILGRKVRESFTDGGQKRRARLDALFRAAQPDGRVPVPVEEPQAIDEAVLAGMLRPGGNFSRTFPGFEHRAQQVEMLTAVTTAFNEGQHLLVEAGTGTGKSMAYLLPAAFWAYENGRRVVISTNTINLQDQLINKDIPDLQRALPFTLRAAVRKGRSNYLCTRLFQQLRHNGPGDGDEMTLYARILLWLPRTQTGDVAELIVRTPGEWNAWSRLNGDNAVCTTEHCATENCPLHLARRRAELAHLIIVNHALLLSDVANGGHILPEFKDLIIDEGHHLEAAVTDGLSFRADQRFLEAILDEVNSPRGLLAETQRQLQATLPPHLSDRLLGSLEQIRREGQQAAIRLQELFLTLNYFLADQVNGRTAFPEQIRLLPAVRTMPGYDEVELSWDNLHKHLHAISKGFNWLAEALMELADAVDLENGDDLRLMLVNHVRSLNDTCQNLQAIIAAPSETMIYWVEVFKERASLHAAPLHVGPLVEAHIFNAKETVILTSATMRTAGPEQGAEPGFGYIRSRLHAGHAEELAVGSPFDYKSRTLLYLVTDVPEPNQPGYQRYVEQAIVDVAATLGGRTMVLFTSYSQLQQTARAVERPLAEAGITLLAQTTGSSRQQLLAQFKGENSRSVLLGTKSFWEGVDVPGEALQAVLIARLPFDVPSDPIFAARSETFENSFFEYSIPEAVLRFRQGFGRLIRRQDDEGMVVVLDRRLLTKRYGQLFLASLPECTVVRQRAARLSELTHRWQNRERQR